MILCQPKTGFNSIRYVLNISTKWKQHMWLTLLRGHASLNVEWMLSHQSAEQLLLPKPRNIVSRRSFTHWMRKGKTAFLLYNQFIVYFSCECCASDADMYLVSSNRLNPIVFQVKKLPECRTYSMHVASSRTADTIQTLLPST